MRAYRRYLLIGAMVVITGLLVALPVYLLQSAPARAGVAIAAELREQGLALIDYLRHDDGLQRRTTLVDLATGKPLTRDIENDAPTGYFQPREQYCATTRDLTGFSPLIVPPYAGELGAARRAEVPAGKILVAPHTGALGFLLAPGRGPPIELGEDVLYSHMYSFDASQHASHPESWLSRLGPDGTPRWSRKLAGGCQLAVLRGDTLVVAMKSGEHRAIGLDVTTGQPRWQFDH